MKKYKKRPAWILVCAAALAAALCACAPEEAPPVSDTQQDAVQADASTPPAAEPQPLRHAPYMQGENGYFFPQRALTRAEAAQLLWNLFGDSGETAQYDDVNGASWYAAGVSAVAAYLPGYDDGRFHPGQEITLSEFVSAVCGALDVGSGDPVAMAEAMGWLEPEEDLEGSVTRARSAVILNRALGRFPDEEAIDALPTPSFLDIRPGDEGYYDVLEAALGHDCLAVDGTEVWDGGAIAGARLSPGLHTAYGAAHYVLDDGSVYTEPGLLDHGGETYLIGGDGQVVMDDGLHPTEGGMVFATAGGPILKNGSWNDYHFDADGLYTSGDEALDAFVAAALAECTTDGMTREEKLRACHEYVRDFRYLGRNSSLPGTVKTMPEENAVAYAVKIFDTGKGDCYNFTAAFLYLARALGYESTAIIGRCGYSWGNVSHSWVEIVMDGETWLFDPQIENYNLRSGISNETHGAYQVTYETAPGRYFKN